MLGACDLNRTQGSSLANEVGSRDYGQRTSSITRKVRSLMTTFLQAAAGFHLVFHGFVERFGFELAEGITGGFQVVCHGLREALVEGGVFPIDHHTVDIVRGNLVRYAMGFILRRHGG